MATAAWTKPRHRLIRNLLLPFIGTYARLKYHIDVEKFRQQGSRQYLIVMNHQTAFDQFFVSMAFRGAVYYVASEDLFSMGFLSRLLQFAVAPIPIQKQTTDVKAVKTCIKVAREGGTIALAPEGNRTFDGTPVHINPAIAKLARKLGLPVAIFRIEGGYGVHPRWSDVVRKGKMRAYVSQVIEPEEYAALSDEALFEKICRGLDVRENAVTGRFLHRKNAEFLERAIYYCPNCGLSTFHSRDDVIVCRTCGLAVRHLPTKELEGVDTQFPYPFVHDWYQAQSDYVNRFDSLSHTEKPLYTEYGQLRRVLVYKRKEPLLQSAQISLYGDRVEICGGGQTMVFPFSETAAFTVLGKNKLNIYFDRELFQWESDCHFNALKYVNLFHRYQNLIRGDGHGKFLGL